MKITIGKSGNRNVSFDLDTLLSTRLLIQANSGAGKSYLLRKLMEELFGHVQVIVIDPEGEFATLREKYGFVLVGKGGETPADIRTAAIVAEKLLELRASAVCDLFEMKPGARHAWVRAFLDAMVNAPKKLWHPVILIVDEAHIFCPEKEKSEASEAMIDLATRGRKRGFCAVFATQRLGKLRKDAAAELQNVLIGGTFLDIDVKRSAETLGIPPGKQEREFAAHMKVIQPGTFIALGRAISKERIELRVGEVVTSHPKPGSSKHAAEPPAPPEKVRELLPKLADLPKIAEEKAATVQDLKTQIRELKNQLSVSKPPSVKADPEEIKKLRAQLSLATRNVRSLRSSLEEVSKVAEKIVGVVQQKVVLTAEDFREPCNRLIAEIVKTVQKKVDVGNREFESLASPLRRLMPGLMKLLSEPLQAPESERSVQSLSPAISHKAAPTDMPRVEGLNKAQVAIISALAEFEALGRASADKKNIAVLSKVSHASSSYQNNLGSLRSAGYIDYPQPGVIALTELGRAIAPHVEAPTSPEEMLEKCKVVMTPPQGFILDALAESYPRSLEKSAIAEKVGVSSASSSFQNNLGSLRTAGMIEYPGTGLAKLSSWVMLEF